MTWEEAFKKCSVNPISETEQFKLFTKEISFFPAPTTVYFLTPDEETENEGEIIMEWNLPGDVIHRIEFNDKQKNNFMTSFGVKSLKNSITGNSVFGEFV